VSIVVRHKVGLTRVDVFDAQPAGFRRLERIPTVSGARTSLFVPELDFFLLAVRATVVESAAIWIFKPSP
jgi:hypothetical protein